MVSVYCGSDDWEFERDRHWWRVWITNEVTNTPFVIIPDEVDASKAFVIFEAGRYDTLFALRKPEYITYELIRGYVDGE